MMQRVLLAAILLAVASGCATNRYVGPTSGRSADAQWGVSRALDRALESLDWGVARDKAAAVTVATLTESYGGRSAEERYLEEAARRRLREEGARVTGGEAAELEVVVLARVLGVNRTRRDFIPLYYSELVEGVAEVDVLFVTATETRVQSRSAAAARRRSYLFYMFGPIVREWPE
ncbi:MAG: hypothetical protein AB1578_14820 [Thermodesulfobacteriota bacterium]